MTDCNHPAPNRDRILRGSHVGEYVAKIGSDLAQGEIWATDKIDKAHDLCRDETAATARTSHSTRKRCSNCGGEWAEVSVRPTSLGYNAAYDLIST